MARRTRKAPPRKAAPKRKAKSKFGLKKMFRNWNWQRLFKMGLVLGFWGGVVLVIAIAALSFGLPNINKAVDMEQRPSVIMRDINGVEFARLGDIQGEILKVGEMSPHLVNAVIAIEDRRFYKHLGVDPFGLARAIWVNIRGSGLSQGGSTITQQLAKNLFLSPERTFTRKIKEALLALYLERRYSKNEILAAYLNRAYFGAGAYGVDSAARVYFNSSARRLNLEQSAMLAGLLKGPSRYSPMNDPKLTMQRTRTVLMAMVDAGYLRPGAEKMQITPFAKRDYNVGGSYDLRYYADWIMSQVESYTGNSTQDLLIDTTLDPKIQLSASQKLRDIITKDGPKLNAHQAALVTMQPNGAVVAMVGGRDYGESQYNRATQSLRQPGSSFKPFIYLAALEAGYTPQTQVLDAPVKIGKYKPENYDGKYRGTVTLQDAVANSLNTVAVRTLQDVGISKVKSIAQRMGITEDLTSDLSLALGASDVHVLSMVSAYATLANRGLASEPYGIKMIRTPKGNILYQRKPVPMAAVLSANAVANMNKMLQAVIVYGTGQRAMIDRPAAGKTGTSSNYRDAWFLGYTSDYVTGVWVGNDDNSQMKRVTGGMIPARIWHDVMLSAESGLPIRPLPTASSIEPVILPPGAPSQQVPVMDQQESGGNMFDRLLDNIIGDHGQPAPASGPIQWDN
ncbi:MAG: carboxypeptidase, partial [Alphaproteobacteria bacterium]|nr:carboxypeptidase [Alphaproteobacteria bacterium]